MGVGDIVLGRKTGLNPTIPLCPYCGKEKNEIILTGLSGEKWAEEHGYNNGQMPMCIYLEGDIEPCDKCKEQGIGIVEISFEKSYTGRKWLVKEELIRRLINNEELLRSILKKRVVLMSEETIIQIGLN